MKNLKINGENQNNEVLKEKQKSKISNNNKPDIQRIDDQIDLFAEIIVDLILNEQNEKAEPATIAGI